jgi:hypothetical protein
MTSSLEIRTITNPQERRTTISSHAVVADRSSRRLLGLPTMANDELPIPASFTEMAA